MTDITQGDHDGFGSRDMGGSARNDDRRWRELLDLVRAESREVVSDFMARVDTDTEYPVALIPREDIESSARNCLEHLLDSAGRGELTAGAHDFAESFGARRAHQAIPPEALIRSVRMDFEIIWAWLLRVSTEADAPVLTRRSVGLSQVIRHYHDISHAAYLEERVTLAATRQQVRDGYVRELFGPSRKSPEVLRQVAAALHVDADEPFCLAALPTESVDERWLRERRTEVHPHLFAWHREDGRSLIFWPGRYRSSNVDAVIAARPSAYLENLPGLAAVAPRSEAVLSLLSVSRVDDPQPATVDNSWHRLAGAQLRTVGIDLAARMTCRLQELPTEERTRLAVTLRVYLESGNALTTAQRLYVHRNTVLNRIRRIQDLLDLDFSVPAHVARAYVALDQIDCERAQPRT